MYLFSNSLLLLMSFQFNKLLFINIHVKLKIGILRENYYLRIDDKQLINLF